MPWCNMGLLFLYINIKQQYIIKKRIDQLLEIIIGCKKPFTFGFICVSELLGSAKKVNVNFQDTDG